MANQFPKHVRKRRANALQYRRRIKGADSLFFERAMQCKASDDESLIQKEAAQMTRLYELEQKRRSIEHPDAFSEAEIEVLAADLLRDLSKKEHYEIKAGSLYPPQTQSVSLVEKGIFHHTTNRGRVQDSWITPFRPRHFLLIGHPSF